jgi:pimeloyl-ACP methyl ester carboxylesterase
MSIRPGVDRRLHMTANLSLTLTLSAALAAGTGCSHNTPAAPVAPTAGPRGTAAASEVPHGHVAVNGVDYYYEVHGTGEPLLLLHGGLMSIDMFAPVLPALSAHRQVIAVDLHGHGRSSLGDRAIDLKDMGDDMAAIVAKLGHPTVDVMGYSLGAGVAFRLAVQHPEAVRRLVLVSAGFSTAGFYPELLPMQAQVGAGLMPMMKDTPMYTSYVAVAPRPDDFPKLLDALGAYMREPFDWTEDVKRVTAPTMLVYGDSDMFQLEHVTAFYKLLGGGQRDAGWTREHMAKNRLAIIPDATHYDMFETARIVPTVLPFLDGASGPQL